jgi:hypothetical protein
VFLFLVQNSVVRISYVVVEGLAVSRDNNDLHPAVINIVKQIHSNKKLHAFIYVMLIRIKYMMIFSGFMACDAEVRRSLEN